MSRRSDPPAPPASATARATGVLGRCPLCGKPAQAAFQPFCSAGCRDRDLLKWLNEDYRVPAGPADEDGDDRSSASRDDDGY
ncbi:DNA gyrase inhibitor YacG [Parapedomonas caeni]